MKRVLLITVIAGCGSNNDVTDASAVDGSAELPTVEPRGPRCADLAPKAGRRCIEQGWYLFSRWTTARYHGTGEAPAIPTGPVYLDTFLVDEHEVTNAEYAAYVQRSGATPPPELCGYQDRDPFLNELEISGWVGGQSDPGRGDHPVVCVTRGEAKAFCEDRGGHLPDVFEWGRTVRDIYPDERRFPWGNTPPPEHAAPWPDSSGYWFLHYATLSRGAPGLQTVPVGSAVGGASAAGIFDLAGSVSEMLSTCAEELGSAASTAPLVRPDGGGRKERCAERIVVAGSSWRSTADPQFTFASSIYVMGGAYNSNDYPEPTHGIYANSTIVEGMIGNASPTASVSDPAGNDRRSWRVGWRCAYDAAL